MTYKLDSNFRLCKTSADAHMLASCALSNAVQHYDCTKDRLAAAQMFQLFDVAMTRMVELKMKEETTA